MGGTLDGAHIEVTSAGDVEPKSSVLPASGTAPIGRWDRDDLTRGQAEGCDRRRIPCARICFVPITSSRGPSTWTVGLVFPGSQWT